MSSQKCQKVLKFRQSGEILSILVALLQRNNYEATAIASVSKFLTVKHFCEEIFSSRKLGHDYVHHLRQLNSSFFHLYLTQGIDSVPNAL